VSSRLPGREVATRLRRAVRSRQEARDALTRLRFRVPVLRGLAARRARRALEAESIAFVCYGNICRSPFAEHVARRHLGSGRRIVSAGFYPEEGRGPPGVAIDVARELGVDLASHRSKVFDEELAREAEAIFVFDQANYRNVLEAHPTARGRVHFIGALAEHGHVVVADPFGAPREHFVETYERITALIAGGEASRSPLERDTRPSPRRTHEAAPPPASDQTRSRCCGPPPPPIAGIPPHLAPVPRAVRPALS
jgi:protein-tyrosine-phosphatase